MTSHELQQMALRIVASGRGILAMDESITTCNARFAAAGIDQDIETRRAWRELLVTTPGLSGSVGAAILSTETLRDRLASGQTFVDAATEAGLIVGVKVDLGAYPMPGHPAETLTHGLEDLRERLLEYARLGAHFAKWRAVFNLDETIPSAACVDANTSALADYAYLCHDTGLVPIVEPEVLGAGQHNIRRCGDATRMVLEATFEALERRRVAIEGVVLKVNMVTPGKDWSGRVNSEVIAENTLKCLHDTVPESIPGATFLSGGQSGGVACANLNAIARLAADKPGLAVWPLSFSFGRATQYPALDIWGGHPDNFEAAQTSVRHRARCAWQAMRGIYDPMSERLAA